jgi:archaetidylinositol phosphate synthase
LKRDQFFAEWSRIHGGAEVQGIVRAWLVASYWLTRPLIWLRVTPNLLTCLSVLLGALFVLNIESNLAIICLALSLLLDGIDGTVAIIRDRATRFGALLDAFADRIVESLWAYGFILMGAPFQIVIIAWLASFIQEYMRARAAGLGITKVLIVTPAERPVRATLIFIALVARSLGLDFNLLLSATWALLQSYSAMRILIILRSQLRQSQR